MAKIDPWETEGQLLSTAKDIWLAIKSFPSNRLTKSPAVKLMEGAFVWRD
jgi:hypothetical protein